jgi:hypothetical protein
MPFSYPVTVLFHTLYHVHFVSYSNEIVVLFIIHSDYKFTFNKVIIIVCY